MTNTYYMAAAGSGKTTYFVNEILKVRDNVLITTFTEENKAEITKKFLNMNNGIIPSNVTIKTWFSFLIEHGVKPFQGTMTKKKINGLLLVNKKSGVKYYSGNRPIYYKESEVDNHYFSKAYEIYSDKLSKFVVKCNEKSNGAVIKRIANIFPYIYIDEVQDMAGYDLEIIKFFFKSTSTINLAGDPRQVTYHTHFADKYKKYNNGAIDEFITNECRNLNVRIDVNTLKDSWRNNSKICDFGNLLFPQFPKCNSNNKKTTDHDGIFLIKEKDVQSYLEKYNPTQLRHSVKKKVDTRFEVKNFGSSKGLTRDRILIYPTNTIVDWISDNKELKFESKCKFYVAITRAKYSVAIVCSNKFQSDKVPMLEMI